MEVRRIEKSHSEMLNRQLIDLIERIGFISKGGVYVRGAAAVSCFTYATIDDLNQSAITYGRKILESYLKHQFV